MATTPITFIKGDRSGMETDYRELLPQNMFAILSPIFGADGYMLEFQGLTEIAQGSGKDRGSWWNDIQQAHFRVSGDKLIRLEADDSVTELGTIPGTDTVSMANSFKTQAVVADGRYFLYDPTNGFREVTDPDLGNPIDILYVDGYYFFTDGQDIYHTDLDDEEQIDPLKSAVSEFEPDQTYGLARTEDNKVLVAGRYSITYYVNDASEDFAFAAVPSRSQRIGMVGTHCIANSSGKFYILGGRREESISVHLIGVGGSQPVSNREVDKVISTYTELELRDAVLETYEEDGYKFLMVHLPNDTLLYNETLGDPRLAWSILSSGTGDSREPFRGIYGVFDVNRGVWVYGDRQTNLIGELDKTEATQYGEIAEWRLYTPFMYLDGQCVDHFEVETIPGFTGSDDATVFMSTTYNGVVWSKQWIELYGLPLDYEKRFILRRLGYVPHWFAIQLRGATRSRMAFARAFLRHE